MERQLYPASKIKVGATLYEVMGYEWEGRIILNVSEWIVRTIQKKQGSQTRYGRKLPEYMCDDSLYVNLAEKIDGVTWGKRSKKIGDYGWLGSISQQHRKRFKVGERLPSGLYTTKLAAFKYALKQELDSVKWYEDKLSNGCGASDRADYEEELDEARRIVRTIKTRITKERNKTPRKLP